MRATRSDTQLSMPGMPVPGDSAPTRCCTVNAGQEVQYQGKINGGPRYGSFGVVKQALRHRAVVDMGQLGTWHIPYYFLVLPQAA